MTLSLGVSGDWDPARLSLLKSSKQGLDVTIDGTTQESANRTLATGDTINGRYRIDGVIGEGGMGVVYHAKDALHPDRTLALKTIQSSMITPERIRGFKSEFKIMADLRHPNIAAVYDFEVMQGSGDCFFTMDYVQGRNALDASRGRSQDRTMRGRAPFA